MKNENISGRLSENNHIVFMREDAAVLNAYFLLFRYLFLNTLSLSLSCFFTGLFC
jgi:hypothetical protein